MGYIAALALSAPLAAQAQMSPDKASAIKAVISFRTAFVEGRMGDALAMAPPCVLDQLAADQGVTPKALIAARRDETTMIRTLAKSGDYVFQTDVSRGVVVPVSDTVKVFTFDATAQLGALMPARQSRMVAVTQGGDWHVTSANSKADRKMLTACIPGLRPRHLR